MFPNQKIFFHSIYHFPKFIIQGAEGDPKEKKRKGMLITFPIKKNSLRPSQFTIFQSPFSKRPKSSLGGVLKRKKERER
jgi:hypothetical protein